MRLDYQLSPQNARDGQGRQEAGSSSRSLLGNQSHPAATGTNQEYNDEILGQFTQVLSNRALNEIKVGKAVFGLANANLTTWSNHWQTANGITTGSPRITFTGFAIAGNQNLSAPPGPVGLERARRLHLLVQREAAITTCGLGGEFLNRHQIQANCRQCMGTIDATEAAAAVAGQLEALVPGSVQRRHLESGGDLPARAQLHHRRRRLQRPSLFEEDRQLGAGRLADRRAG